MECVSYYETASGSGVYMPIVTVFSEDGKKDFRELVKGDILRIPDITAKIGEENGGWLFKRSITNNRVTWLKRYMILRGSYLFIFHNPQNERPCGLIPLENCDIVCPKNGAKSFTPENVSKFNDGFEFCIRHNYRGDNILYAQSEEERDLWMQLCAERNGRINNEPIVDSHNNFPSSTFDSSSSASKKALGRQNVSVTQTYLSPSPTKSGQRESNFGLLQGGHLPGGQTLFAPPPPPTQVANNAPIQSSYNYDVTASPSKSVNFASGVNSTHSLGSNNKVISNIKSQSTKLESAIAESRDKDEQVKRQGAAERRMLERDLQEKMKLHQEGRIREQIARERGTSKQRLDSARAQEAKNPMTLAELFRCLLFFVNEQLVEEPLPDTPLQFPHLKGAWAENMLVSVYQRYCRSTGFMSLEEFVEFMDDAAILRTHVPRDENDEPMQDFQAQLDPVRLLTTVPRNLGYSRDMENALSANDNFCLNFAQFYQLLLRIAHVTYAELYQKDSSHAMNKLLQESILPLYAWTQGHHKRGSQDILVTEERIVLLLATYAPNIWKVFLLYCQDNKSKVPEVAMPYPESAKRSERVLFGVPYNAPYSRNKESGTADDVGYFVTENACMRFCQDYGLMPHLITKQELKDLLKSLNRPKSLEIARPIKSQQPPTVFYQKTQTTLRREYIASQMHQRAADYQPMHFSGAENIRIGETKGLGGGGQAKKLASGGIADYLGNPNVYLNEHGGLGFSEFVELIARIATIGMTQEAYHVLFPSPFSKVLAILTVWGIADLKKVEEVKVIRSAEILY